MIDTIRFTTILTDECIDQIKKNSVRTQRVDLLLGLIETEYYRKEVHVPSSSQKFNIFFVKDEPNRIYFELSLPKFIYRTNIVLLEENIGAISKLYKLLNYLFPGFPNPKHWEITRLDICYSWKFENDDQALTFLNQLRNFHLPKQTNVQRSTSIYSNSQNIGFKLYMKHPEFMKNSFNILRKHGYENFAYELAKQSEGVLRFEITLRKQALKRQFKCTKMHINRLNEKEITNALKHFFYRMYPVTIETDTHIYAKLQALFGKKKAFRLFNYYTTVTKYGIKYLDEGIGVRMQQLNRADLKKANISTLPKSSVDFNIPSRNVVAKYLTPCDARGARHTGCMY